jgi:hypothetical protein
MRTWLLVPLFFVLVLHGAPSTAEEARKISVSVRHSGDDNVGQRVAFAVREAVRSSHGYELVSGPSALLRVYLVSLDPDRENDGHRTAISYVLAMRNLNEFREGFPASWYPIYLTSGIVTCGTNRVQETAQSIVAKLDAALEVYREDVRGED